MFQNLGNNDPRGPSLIILLLLEFCHTHEKYNTPSSDLYSLCYRNITFQCLDVSQLLFLKIGCSHSHCYFHGSTYYSIKVSLFRVHMLNTSVQLHLLLCLDNIIPYLFIYRDFSLFLSSGHPLGSVKTF